MTSRNGKKIVKSYSYVPDWAAEHNAAMPANAPVVDVYARLSRNPAGELEKIDDQIDDGRTKILERRRWKLGMIHVDNSLSAWKKGVRRPGWERLLVRLESRAVAGAGVYHQDRLMRQPRDLEKLIDLADKNGTLLASAHGERDLSDPDDRFILRIEVAHACRCSDDTSRRTKLRNKGLRRRGQLTGGPRSFGFPGLDRVTNDGRRVSEEQVAAEREAILDGSRRVAAGVSLWNIAQKWNAAGLRTSTGVEWGHITVRQMLSRERNAGRITHDGVVVGVIVGDEPIVGDELFARVQATFAARRRGAPSARYIASGLVHCGVCGNGLTGRPAGKWANGPRPREYYCMKMRGGCNRICIVADGVDAEVLRFVIARLSDPAHTQRLSAIRQEHDKRVELITAELADIEQLRQSLSDRLGRREMKLAAYDTACKPLDKDEARLLGELKTLVTDDPNHRQIKVAARREEIRADWENGTDSDRRVMLEKALEGYRLVIKRADPTKPRKFDPNRVQVEKV